MQGAVICSATHRSQAGRLEPEFRWKKRTRKLATLSYKRRRPSSLPFSPPTGGGGVLKRQEGECLFLDPRAHPGLFLPHSVLGQPCFESFLWEVSVHKLHVIPAPGGKSWGSWRPTDLGRRWENDPRSADGKTGETLRGTCLSRATTLMRRRSLV